MLFRSFSALPSPKEFYRLRARMDHDMGRALAAFEKAGEKFEQVFGRRYRLIEPYRCEDAEYLIVGQGSLIPTAEAVADWMREERGIKVGVVDLVRLEPRVLRF